MLKMFLFKMHLGYISMYVFVRDFSITKRIEFNKILQYSGTNFPVMGYLKTAVKSFSKLRPLF